MTSLGRIPAPALPSRIPATGSAARWLRVLDGVCQQLGVDVAPTNAFLGHGATGFVFRVQSNRAGESSASSQQALKISRDAAHIDSLTLEVIKTRAVRQRASACASVLNVLPDAPSDVKLVLDSTEMLGAGFTFGPVGETVASQERTYELWEEILGSLLQLHRLGEVHGDPRLPNLVRCWRSAGLDRPPSNRYGTGAKCP